MPEPAEPASKPPRTWRPMVLWTAGILLALALAWFVGAVAVPLLKTRNCLEEHSGIKMGPQRAIDMLGGPQEAVRGLAIYYRAPKFLAPHRTEAIRLLGYCCEEGRQVAALAVLRSALQSEDDDVRNCAAESLVMRDEPEIRQEVIRVLQLMCQNSDYRTCRSAAFAFGRIRPVDQRAVALLADIVRIAAPDDVTGCTTGDYSFDQWLALRALGEMGRAGVAATQAVEEALKSSHPVIRTAAAEALKTIAGEPTSAPGGDHPEERAASARPESPPSDPTAPGAPADQGESRSSPRDRARTAYLQVADGSPEDARAAVAALHAMCKKGEPDYSPRAARDDKDAALYTAVAHFGFAPVWRGLMGEQSYVCQSRSGCAILERAVPRMIALMKDGQQAEIDYLLRNLQGCSPQGTDWASWNAWQQGAGKGLFKVPCREYPVKVVD
mgnify:FL=1